MSSLSDSLPAESTTIATRWQVVHQAAAVVARLAGGEAGDVAGGGVPALPVGLRDAGGWRRRMAEQSLDDIAMILETGIIALIAVRPANPAAARALWDEFVAAREALLSLAISGTGERRPVA